jgi:hypothetical protein
MEVFLYEALITLGWSYKIGQEGNRPQLLRSLRYGSLYGISKYLMLLKFLCGEVLIIFYLQSKTFSKGG